MRVNSVIQRRLSLLIAVILSVSCLTLLFVSAHTDTALEAYIDYELGYSVLDKKDLDAFKEVVEVKYLHTVRDNIVSALGANNEDKRENTRAALGAGVDLSAGSAAAAFLNQTEDTLDGIKLKARFDAINATIEAYVTDNIVPLFEGIEENEEEGIERIVGYNELYDQHERQYNNLTPKYKKKADLIANGSKEEGSEGKGLMERIDQPTADTFGVMQCPKCNGWYKTVDEFCKPELKVSFNKTSFGTGDELVVKVKIKDLYLANMYISGGFRAGSYPESEGSTKTKMSTTFTHDDIGYSEVKINVWYTRKDGSLGLIEELQYINVEKKGYFDNGDSFSAYESYEAEVFDNRQIYSVSGYMKKPGSILWKKVKWDVTYDGASWSYPINSKSKSGTYKVKVQGTCQRLKGEVYRGGFYYEDSFTVH